MRRSLLLISLVLCLVGCTILPKSSVSYLQDVDTVIIEDWNVRVQSDTSLTDAQKAGRALSYKLWKEWLNGLTKERP